MKMITFAAGAAVGMAIAGAAVAAVYPDVARRMTRDARRMVRCGKKMACSIFG